MAEWTAIGGTLFSSAKGRSWREEAACWVLAESGAGRSCWPDRLQEAGLLAWETQEDEDWDRVFVRWSALAHTLAFTEHDAADGLHGTGAEWCVLRFACSLMTGEGGDWGADLSRLDHSNRQILLGALTWAAGGEKAAHPYILLPPQKPEPDPPSTLHVVN